MLRMSELSQPSSTGWTTRAERYVREIQQGELGAHGPALLALPLSLCRAPQGGPPQHNFWVLSALQVPYGVVQPETSLDQGESMQ